MVDTGWYRGLGCDELNVDDTVRIVNDIGKYVPQLRRELSNNQLDVTTKKLVIRNRVRFAVKKVVGLVHADYLTTLTIVLFVSDSILEYLEHTPEFDNADFDPIS